MSEEDFPLKDKSRRSKRRRRNHQAKFFHEEQDGLFRPKIVESKKRQKKKISRYNIEEYFEDV